MGGAGNLATAVANQVEAGQRLTGNNDRLHDQAAEALVGDVRCRKQVVRTAQLAVMGAAADGFAGTHPLCLRGIGGKGFDPPDEDIAQAALGNQAVTTVRLTPVDAAGVELGKAQRNVEHRCQQWLAFGAGRQCGRQIAFDLEALLFGALRGDIRDQREHCRLAEVIGTAELAADEQDLPVGTGAPEFDGAGLTAEGGGDFFAHDIEIVQAFGRNALVGAMHQLSVAVAAELFAGAVGVEKMPSAIENENGVADRIENAAERGLAGLCFSCLAMVGDEQCRQLAGLTDDFAMLFGEPARRLAVAGECTQQFAIRGQQRLGPARNDIGVTGEGVEGQAGSLFKDIVDKGFAAAEGGGSRGAGVVGDGHAVEHQAGVVAEAGGGADAQMGCARLGEQNRAL